jgi:outer membrane protein OmpA-like peptidoglycan-associated protein
VGHTIPGIPGSNDSRNRWVRGIRNIQRSPDIEIELDGFADNQGDLLKDKVLSQDRVKTVKSYLVHHGIHTRRITTKAFGGTHLVSDKPNEESRRLNRRVEFVILKK